MRPAGTVLLLFTCAPFCSVAAPGSPQDKIDAYVTAEMRREHIPGLELGIYRRGEIVKARGYGLADVELNVPVKPQTVFQSGSVGKQFAATAVMMLVEEGKIGLEDSVTKYFDRAPAMWKPVKVKNLLSHTSGLAEYETPARTKPGAPFYLRLDCSEGELFDKIAALPMDFQPGERWRYTNTNYVLLGMIIRKVTGRFYGDFLAERIFRPLGMPATRVISDRDIIPNRSSGYEWTKEGLKNQEWVSPTYNSTADGTLYFNVLDLAKWDAALYTEKLVKKASLDRMWTVFPLNDGKPNPDLYGFAWWIRQQNGHRLIEHTGSWQGFAAYIGRYVDDGLTVAVLANLDSDHAHPARIGHEVAGLYNAVLAVPEERVIADNDLRLTAFVRATLESIAAGMPDPQAFTTEARAELFPDDIQEAGTFLKNQGPFERLELIESTEKDRGRARRYRWIARDGTVVLGFTFDKDNRIARMDISPE
ncbi:MAG TPA: serine hydrolase domain-containing protein [Bryobacteraceae bacterium]|nr:serine hydrolase domain-containing protein [Bryobacteraceae bacterium]